MFVLGTGSDDLVFSHKMYAIKYGILIAYNNNKEINLKLGEQIHFFSGPTKC